MLRLNFFTCAHTAIVKLLKLPIFRVIFERHRRVEHLYHLAGQGKLSILLLLIRLLLFLVFNLGRIWPILLYKAVLCVKYLARILILDLAGITGNLYHGTQLLRWLLIV